MDLTVAHGLNSLKAEKEKQQQKKERNRRATILNFIDIHISVSFLRGVAINRERRGYKISR